jgi:hypothetical protein
VKKSFSTLSTLTIALLLAGFVPAPLVASAPLTQQPAVVPVTARLTVVISRYNGEKKVGSLPFTLMVIPGDGSRGDGERTELQTGARVPVPQTTFNQEKGSPTTSYAYQQFGTNIGAAARILDPATNTFSVSLTVTDSQLLSDAPEQTQYAQGVRLPRYQSFSSSNRLILRDGQTVQYTAATDKTSGEVIKLDVTLNVIK